MIVKRNAQRLRHPVFDFTTSSGTINSPCVVWQKTQEGDRPQVFISFEGIEGCGKTTQVQRLASVLAERGIPHVVTREPGGTRVGRKIRRILLDPAHEEMEALTELLLYAADRAQHATQVIRPALAAGHWLICDRFADATTAYQGYGRGQDLGLLDSLHEVTTQNMWPQITLLLDCPGEIGLKRARQRLAAIAPQDREDRFELEVRSFHQRVREGYLKLAAEHAERFIVLDGTLSPERLHQQIVSLLDPHLSG